MSRSHTYRRKKAGMAKKRKTGAFFVFLVAAGILVTIVWLLPRDNILGFSGNVICIDPGHGGGHSGAVNGNRQEKDDNLLIAKAVKKCLEQDGYRVVMTRTGDETVSLEERTNIANRKRAAAFVSLHRNSGDSKGTEVWVHSTAPELDSRLAQRIYDKLVQTGVSSERGVKYGYRTNHSDKDYWVNSQSDMPSCLVELGFMQSDEDNNLFDSKLEEYARAIADGIIETLENR